MDKSRVRRGDGGLKVILIDDEQLALDVLEIQLLELGGIEVAGKYTNPIQALHDIKKLKVDVVFLDMEMPQIHGLNFAENLLTAVDNLEIVFITGHPQFALEAFEVNAIDYLLKPVIYTRLEKTINRLKERIQLYKEPDHHHEYLTAHSMGNFQLYFGQNQEVKWRTKKVKEFFIYLWVHQKKRGTKERLMEELWSELPLAKASRLMHTTVYQLRKTLKDIGIKDPILSVNNQYILNVKVKSDLLSLEKSINQTENKYIDLEEIIHLYSGDFLEEEGYSWAIDKQLAIKKLFLKYLEDFIAGAKDNLDKSYLIELSLDKMLQLEPYNEQYLYLILEHFQKTKNSAKMMEHFQSARLKWREELGLELGKEITSLYSAHLQEK